MWKINLNDKPIPKTKNDHIQTQKSNMFVIVELFYELGERGKGKENDRSTVIS
jgi:hypothetical protein